MSQPKILLLGAPGAGKGTQSSNVVEHYGVDHVTTGDALRANKDMETDHGTPREFMEAGELVPDPVVNEIVKAALDDADGFVLDGYPRNLSQVEYLSEIADLDLVALLDVGTEELVDRLTGRRMDPETGDIYHTEFNMPDDEAVRDRLVQRDDDTEGTVRERLRVFEENTQPVIDHYEETGELVRIDGEGTPEEVWEALSEAIDDAS